MKISSVGNCEIGQITEMSFKSDTDANIPKCLDRWRVKQPNTRRGRGIWFLINEKGENRGVMTLLSSVQSLSRVHSLWPDGLQHTRLPCPSPSPGFYSNSRPLSQWCHPTISSSVVPFSSCPQLFPSSETPFQRVSSSNQVANVLEFQLQHQSFQWIIRTDFL